MRTRDSFSETCERIEEEQLLRRGISPLQKVQSEIGKMSGTN